MFTNLFLFWISEKLSLVFGYFFLSSAIRSYKSSILLKGISQYVDSSASLAAEKSRDRWYIVGNISRILIRHLSEPTVEKNDDRIRLSNKKLVSCSFCSLLLKYIQGENNKKNHRFLIIIHWRAGEKKEASISSRFDVIESRFIFPRKLEQIKYWDWICRRDKARPVELF